MSAFASLDLGASPVQASESTNVMFNLNCSLCRLRLSRSRTRAKNMNLLSPPRRPATKTLTMTPLAWQVTVSRGPVRGFSSPSEQLRAGLSSQVRDTFSDQPLSRCTSRHHVINFCWALRTRHSSILASYWEPDSCGSGLGQCHGASVKLVTVYYPFRLSANLSTSIKTVARLKAAGGPPLQPPRL
jgi:hypothetical protein